MLVPTKRTRWLGLVFSWRGSALARVKYRLLSVFVVSVVLTVLQELEYFDAPLGLPALSLMGIALGIFLGFRNNTAYDRYWEGRKLWGQLVNTSRSFSRLLLAFLPANSLPEPREDSTNDSEQRVGGVTPLARQQIYRIIAFSHALRLHLRHQLKKKALADWLDQEDLHAIAEHANVPNAILLRISSSIAEAAGRGEISDIRHVEIERYLSELSNIQGGCERIKNTPIPHSYNILIHSIVALYVFALPLGLTEQLHIYTPLMVVLIAYTFLGLDAVGEEIEDPFGEDLNDLPLTTLSRMIEVNLRQTLGETDVPPLLHPVHGRLT